jgi:RND family efflux transporter MFP subunit
VVTALSLHCLVLAAVWSAGCRSETGADPAPAAPLAEPAVAHAPAVARPIAWTGVIASAEAVDLAPSFDGVLAEVRVGPGDVVAAGQVLALLDERPLREELDSALAALRETRARGPRIAVDIRSARRRVQIEQQAVESGTSARRVLEEARFALAAARAARGELAAAVAQARIRVDRARSRLASTALRAPFAGSIGSRYRAPGAAVGPMAPVVRLIGGGDLRLRFAAPPDAARTLRVGCAILAEVAPSAPPIPAVIERIAPELDLPSQSTFIEATLDSAATDSLQPGLAVRVRPTSSASCQGTGTAAPR